MKWSFRYFFASLLFLVVAAESRAISKEGWIEAFKREFPKMACTDGQFFRTFYQTTQEVCIAKMVEATEYCIEQEKGNLPTDFNTVDEGRTWGETIGKCAGTRFSKLVPVDPKGWLKLLPKSMTSARIIGWGIGLAVAFFLLVGLIIFWAIRQRRKP